jgi:hypothetical protein
MLLPHWAFDMKQRLGRSSAVHALACLSVLALILCYSFPAEGQEISFSASCEEGQGFIYPLSDSLQFQVTAAEEGCEVRVVDLRDEDRTNLLVPYHPSFYKIQETTVGDSNRWDRHMGDNPRRFSFTASVEDQIRLITEVAALTGENAERVARLYHDLAGLIAMKATLTDFDQAGLRKVSFKVRVHMPRAQLRSEKAGSIYDLELPDVVAGMMGLTPQECMKQVLVNITQRVYRDFDGDGDDDVLVSGFSCLAGTGGMDVFMALRLQDGIAVKIPFEMPGRGVAPQYYKGLRGKLSYSIEPDRIVKKFPVFHEDDPNCCATGGIREFSYIYRDGKFVLNGVKDVPR